MLGFFDEVVMENIFPRSEVELGTSPIDKHHYVNMRSRQYGNAEMFRLDTALALKLYSADQNIVSAAAREIFKKMRAVDAAINEPMFGARPFLPETTAAEYLTLSA